MPTADALVEVDATIEDHGPHPGHRSFVRLVRQVPRVDVRAHFRIPAPKDGAAPVRLDRMRAHGRLGDVSEWIAFSSWQKIDGIWWPRRISQATYELDTAITLDIVIHYDAAPAPGVPIEGLEPLPSFATPRSLDVDPTVTVREHSPDIYAVEVPDANMRVCAVRTTLGLVVLEAPLSSRVGEAVIDALRATLGDVPIAAVVPTHHHPHPCGGVRAFIHHGAELVASPHTIEVARDLVQRSWTLAPDRLASEPNALRARAVRAPVTLGTGDTRVSIRDIGTASEHTEEYLIACIGNDRLLVEGDLLRIDPTGVVTGDRLPALRAAVAEAGWRPAALLQTWPLDGVPLHIDASATLHPRSRNTLGLPPVTDPPVALHRAGTNDRGP